MRAFQHAEATIERYLDAFEADTMSDETCGQRVEKQGAKIAELRVRQRNYATSWTQSTSSRPPARSWPTGAEHVRVAVSQGRPGT